MRSGCQRTPAPLLNGMLVTICLSLDNVRMHASEVPRAVAAAMSIASSLDLTVDDAIVLHDSNKLTLRLLPCDVLARVAPVALQVSQFEVELAHAGMQPLERTGVVGW